MMIPADLPYRKEGTLDNLLHISNSRFRRRKTRDAALAAYIELVTLRERAQVMAIELSEWRWKVAGVAYNINGQSAMALLRKGMADRGYTPIGINDDDLRG